MFGTSAGISHLSSMGMRGGNMNFTANVGGMGGMSDEAAVRTDIAALIASQARVEAALVALQKGVARLPAEIAVLLQASPGSAVVASSAEAPPGAAALVASDAAGGGSSGSGAPARLSAVLGTNNHGSEKLLSAASAPDDGSKVPPWSGAGARDSFCGAAADAAEGGDGGSDHSEGAASEMEEDGFVRKRVTCWASRFSALPTGLSNVQSVATLALPPLRPRSMMPLCKESSSSVWVMPTFNRPTHDRPSTGGQTSRPFLPFHPSSRIRILIDTSIFILLAYDAVMVPYTMAFGTTSHGPLFIISLACTAFWIFELLSNFVSGYTEGDQLHMTVRDSVRHYLRTYFLLDLVVVSCDVIAIAFELSASDGAKAETNLMKIGRIAKAGRLFRIVAMLRTGRLARLGETLLEEAMKVAPALFNGLTISLVKSTFLILWPSHVVCCAWYGFLSSSVTDTGLGWRLTLEDNGLESWPDTYVYALGFYWSLASMLSGASTMAPLNSWECLFSSVHLIFGFIFCSSLISALAAKFIEHQMQNQEQHGKLKTLRKFLHQHRVDGTLGIAIQHQVADRMRGEKRLAYEEVPVLSLLSASLRAELHYNIHADYLRGHDVLLACSEVDDTLIAHLCAAAVTHVAVAPGEQVFQANISAGFMYIVIGGALQYDIVRQGSLTSMYGGTQSIKVDEVTEGRYICELALWLEWTTLGMLEATAPSELLRVAVGAFMSVLATPRHQAVAQVVTDFAAKLCEAIDAEQPAVMTDLRLDVERDAVVASMSVASRALISRPMLGRLERTIVNNSTSWKRLEDLELEVTGGKCHLRLEPTGGRVVRIVQVVCLRLRRPDGAMLVEVAQQRSGSTRATLKLPGSKMRDGETLDDTLQRIQHQALPNAGGVHRAAQEDHIEQGMSEAYGIETKYIRRVCSAMLEAGDEPDVAFWDEVCWVPFEWKGVQFRQQDFCTGKTHNSQSGSDLTLYAWLSNFDFDELESGGQELKQAISQWISGMDLQRAVVLPHDSADNSLSLSSSEAESEGKVEINSSLGSWLTAKPSEYRRSTDERVSGRRRSGGRKSFEGSMYMVIWHSRDGFHVVEAQTLVGARRIFSNLPRYQSRAIFSPDETVVCSWYFSDSWRQKLVAHRKMLVALGGEGAGDQRASSSRHAPPERSSTMGVERRGNPPSAAPTPVAAAAAFASARRDRPEDLFGVDTYSV